MPMYSFSSRSSTSTFSELCQRYVLSDCGPGVSILSTMSNSIADVRKACGGRSTGRTGGGACPRAPPSMFACCGGGVALYTPS